MNLVTRAMDFEDAKEISGWIYEPPYDFYNMSPTGESISELLNEWYRAVQSTEERLIGFYCLGESARVPAGNAWGAYADSYPKVMDFGIGMRPDMTGRGFGTEFLTHVLRDVMDGHPDIDIRLTVATFNQRAITLYQRFGFQRGVEFTHNGATFQTMTRHSG